MEQGCVPAAKGVELGPWAMGGLGALMVLGSDVLTLLLSAL